jgi:hypothetical protein
VPAARVVGALDVPEDLRRPLAGSEALAAEEPFSSEARSSRRARCPRRSSPLRGRSGTAWLRRRKPGSCIASRDQKALRRRRRHREYVGDRAEDISATERRHYRSAPPARPSSPGEWCSSTACQAAVSSGTSNHAPTDRLRRRTLPTARLPARGRQPPSAPRLQHLPGIRPARPRNATAAAPNTDGQTRLPQRCPRLAHLSTEREVTASISR